MSLLSSRFSAASTQLKALMLEAIISRYYCVRKLSRFTHRLDQ